MLGPDSWDRSAIEKAFYENKAQIPKALSAKSGMEMQKLSKNGSPVIWPVENAYGAFRMQFTDF